MSDPKKNKHGLSRNIPAAVAREIRKQCGFGCVICGCGIYQYEHIDPEFHDAENHDSAKVALLCGGCHDRVTRKIWSKEKVREARANPRCLQAGYTRWDLDFGRTSPNVALGELVCVYPREILNIAGEQILAIRPPEDEGAPVRLNGRFYDDGGQKTLIIQDNEILASSGNWDIETVGGTVTIRRGPGDVTLELKVIPRRWILVNRLKMSFREVQVTIADGELGIGRTDSTGWAKKLKGEIWSARSCIAIIDSAYVPASAKLARCLEPTAEDIKKERDTLSAIGMADSETAACTFFYDGLRILLGSGCSYAIV